MTAVLELLRDLTSRGGALRLVEGKLRVAGAPEVLTKSLRDTLREHRDALSSYLSQVDAGTAAQYLSSEGERGIHDAVQLLRFPQAYNIPFALRLRGALDVPALDRALALLARRHPPLRTLYLSNAEGLCRQVVDAGPALQLYDASDAADATAAAALRLQADAVIAFALDHEPPVRFTLVRLGPDLHELQLVAHHIVFEIWSLRRLLEDLANAYCRLHAGASLPDWEPDPAYARLDALQLATPAWLSPAQREQARAWYEDAPTDQLALSARRGERSGMGDCRYFDAPAGTWQRVETLAAQLPGATAFHVLFSAYAIFIGTLSHRNEVLIGSPVVLRGGDSADVIGYHVRLGAVRQPVDRMQSFAGLVQALRGNWLDAMEWQDATFDTIKRLCPELRELSPPDHGISFSYLPLELALPAFDGVRCEVVNEDQLMGLGPRGTSKFDFGLYARPVHGALRLAFEFNAAVAERGVIEAWQKAFLHLLEHLLAQPQAPIASLPSQWPSDPAPAAVAWQRPSGEDALDVAWCQQVQATPDAIAVIADGQHWTYAQLDARANRLARHLQAHGIRRGDLVGLCLPRGNDAITALLATVLAGAAYVPLDPDQPAERLAEILHDAGLLHLVSDEAHLDALDPTTLFGLDLISLDGDPDWLTHSDQPLPPSLGGEDLAYLVYTSGSTGRAKGVAVPHRGVVRLVRDSDYHRGGPGRRLGHAATLAFDAATFEIWGALLTGAAVVVLSKHDLLDPDRLRAACRDHAIDTLFLTTALFNHCVEQLGEVIADLDTVLFGGEQVDPDAVRALLDRHGRVRVLHVYGPTENTTFSSWHPVDAVAPDAATVPIGRALSRSSCLVLDPYLNPVPAGVDGELYVGGAGLARGYWAQPATTAERFLPHPWQPGERLYRTGDLVRWNVHGQLEFVGRRDHQVKLRGYRIELGEVEVALLRHPQVHGTCTQVRELGGRRQLVAWCQVEGPLGRDELKRFVRQHLPEYMVPSVLVTLAQLPLNANGKIDRDRLPDPEADAEPDGAYTAPRDPREAAIAQVWASVLKRERVGIHDNFFELGGDSLLATGVITRMRAAGFTVSVPDLFQRPTVAELAALSPADEAFASVPQSDPYVPFELIAGEDIALRQTATDAYPLSRMQQEMLLQGCLYPASPVYHDVISYRLTLRFDEPALRQALTAVAARFEILRSKVHLSTVSEPLFVIDREASFNLHVTDLHGDEFDLAQWQDRESRCGFDFENELPWRVFVHRLDEREFVLSLSFHHVILDGWSESLLVTTLLDDYRSALGCTLAVADPTAASFGAHVRNEKQACTNPNHREFWTGYLDGAEVLALATATDASTTDAAARAPRRVDVPINHALLAALEQTAAAARANIKSVLLAAHGKVLSLLGGGADVVTGIVTNGRPETPDGDRLIGMYLNSQPLRLRLGHGSWLDLVAHAYQADTQLYAQRLFPLSEVTQATGANRWFDVLFNFTRFRPYLDGTARNDVVERSGVAFNTVALFADFDLGVKPVIRVTAHVGTLAERRLDAYVSLLQAVLARLAHAPAELHHSFQAVPVPATATATAAAPAPLPLLLEAQCRATPDAIAYRHDGQTLDYRTLVIRVERVAAALAVASGDRPAIGTGMCVVVCMRRTLDLPVAMLAVMRLGATCVPVDPDYPAERITLLVDDCNAALALVDAETRSLVGPSIARATLAEVETQAESGVLPLAIAPATIAYLIYTSGSTGMPKGVAIHHGALSSFLDWCGREFDREEAAVVLAGTSVCFDLSVFELFFPLTFGGQALIVPNVLALVSDHTLAPTLLNTVPSAARELAELGAIPASVRAINVAGEPLRGALVARLYERSGVRCVRNLYGPSETTTYSTFTRVPRHDGIEPTIGHAIDVCTVYLLDAYGSPVMDGATGEIYIGGPPVATGYWNRNAATAERFLPDPFSASAGARMYRTGDLARCIDGELHYLGRADHQVKLRGYRIELGEIEVALLRHPQVHGACTQVRELGGRRQLVAWCQVEGPLGRDELKRFVRQHLPEYMVPSVLVTLAQLPLNANGKIDRDRLPDPEADTAHDDAYAAPRDPREAALVQIWAGVLKREHVGIHDNFFELGGDSLLAVRVLGAMSKQLGWRVTFKDFFADPRISAIAARIGAETGTATVATGEPSLWEQVGHDCDLIASEQQLQFWSAQQLSGHHAAYNISHAERLEGGLHVPALERAWRKLIDRHEALHTGIGLAAAGPTQEPVAHLLDRALAQVRHVELGALDADAQHDRLTELAKSEHHHRFDLATELPARLCLARLDERCHVLLMTFHHIAVDGLTIAVVMREFAELYAAESRGQAAMLPPPDCQYRHYAQWQRRRAQDGRLAGDRDYWRKRLAGLESVSGFPVDFARTRLADYRGGTHRHHVPASIVARLREFAVAHGTSLFNAVLAALALTASRISRSREVVVATAVANRAHPDFHNAVGCFINTLPVRLDLGGNPGVGDLLARVHASFTEDLDHQALPLAEIAKLFDLPREPFQGGLQQLMLSFNEQAGDGPGLSLPGLVSEPVALPHDTARTDISIDATVHAGGLTISWEYACGLFAPESIQAFAAAFEAAIAGMTSQAGQRVDAIALAAAPPLPPPLTFAQDGIWHRFSAQATRTPEAPALDAAEGEVSYRELHARAQAWAARLHARGVRAGDRVALRAERCIELVAAILGVLHVGAAYVPIDAKAPLARVRLILEDAGPSAVILGRGDALPAALLPDCVLDLHGEAGPSAPVPAPLAPCGDRVAYVMYTSGSTGRPKGVVVPHRGVLRMAAGLPQIAPGPGLRTALLSNLAFDATTLELWLPLLNGGCCVIGPERTTDAWLVGELVERHRVTAMFFTTSLFNVLVDVAPECLAGLRVAIVGGEACSLPHIARAMATAPTTTFVNGYGPTENTCFSTCHFFAVPPAPDAAFPAPIGAHLHGSHGYVLDRAMQPMPTGAVGELMVCGDGVAAGYFGNPGLTAERFLPDPWRPGQRMYRTGDLVRALGNGELVFVGREDAQVKLRGFRIELSDIERVLVREAGVAAATVILVSGAGEQQLVAFCVPAEDHAPIDEATLLRLARLHLPEYMVPTRIALVTHLPFNDNGKCDHHLLRRLAAELPVPKASDAAPHDAAASARALELLALLQPLFPNSVPGLDDDLIEHGATSLTALRIQAAVSGAFGVRLGIDEIFRLAAVRRLAEQIESLGGPAVALPEADVAMEEGEI